MPQARAMQAKRSNGSTLLSLAHIQTCYSSRNPVTLQSCTITQECLSQEADLLRFRGFGLPPHKPCVRITDSDVAHALKLFADMKMAMIFLLDKASPTSAVEWSTAGLMIRMSPAHNLCTQPTVG